MTTSLHVCILGIDGSGKSTLTSALPYALAAEMNLLAGSAGDGFRIVSGEEDHLAPGFYPDGLPLMAHLSLRFKRAAKRTANNRRLYPILKLAQMLSQDSATYKIGRRYGAQIIASDGNAFLSATGRAANYLRAASETEESATPAPRAEDLRAVFAYVFEGQVIPQESAERLPRLWKGRLIYQINRLFRVHAVWLPDALIFLDLSPDVAMTRIEARHKKIDRHENRADLEQAREMYLKTLAAFSSYKSQDAAHRIPIDELSPGEVIRAVIDGLKPHLLARADGAQREGRAPLGTTELTDNVIRQRAINSRYVFRYLLAKFFRGAWREPTFFFSDLGKLFLKEGYSAGVMRAIYDRDEKQHGWLDKIFLEYPLHRAVYDRLQILVRSIEPEIEARLKRSDEELHIFTAPSGFAYDLFRPLERIARHHPEWMGRIKLIAADLDPHEVLEDELSKRAAKLGIEFEFLRGDLTSAEMQVALAKHAPYDLALFVGLSSWLSKPHLVNHFRWINSHLKPDGLFVTDSFTPAAYALSGRYMGYRAHYYTPEVYRALLDYCGFDGLSARVESGRDGINHVFLASIRH